MGTIDRAKALTDSRTAQRRYRALARWHRDEGDRARAELDFETAGRHFLAAALAGHLALVEKLREPRP